MSELRAAAEQPRTLCPDAYPCPFACGRDAECYRHSLPRAAPAEQPGPVAWRCQFSDGRWHYIHGDRDPKEALSPGMAATLQRLYAAPPPPAAAPVTDAMVEAGWQASAASEFTQAEARKVIEAALAAREGR